MCGPRARRQGQRRESNPQPQLYKSCALPLSYAGRVYYKSLNKILACESPYEAINDTIDKNLIVSVGELFDKYLEWTRTIDTSAWYGGYCFG